MQSVACSFRLDLPVMMSFKLVNFSGCQMKDYLLCFKQQKSRGAGRERAAPEGSLGPDDMRRPLWGNKGLATEGGLWDGLSPSATEGGPPPLGLSMLGPS